jgi:uncharacterized protein (DUF1697 family)
MTSDTFAKELRMPSYVSFFRGINVGGNHQVKMAELRALHEALDLTRVQPYIQSGNVVFRSDEADAEALRRRIEKSFEQRFGFRSEVYVRSAAEMQQIIERNPFQAQVATAPNWVVVTFLPAHTDATEWEQSIAAYPGPEEVVLLGDTLYIYYCNSIGTSKLPRTALGKRLKNVGTGRNWNTLLKLREMMQS